MKPDPTEVLERTAQSLLLELPSEVASAYARSSLSIQGLLLGAVREEFDRAAARRVEENAVLRALSAEGATVVEDAALRRRLEAAATLTDPSLRIPDLDRTNRELRALLVELHAHVESLRGAAARDLEARIWAELRASTERRRTTLDRF